MPDIVPGRVYPFEPGQDQPPTSSLATAFFAKDGLLADAVVLRGYLGRSPILQRARQYLVGAIDAVEAARKEQDKADDVAAKARGAAQAAQTEAAERVQELVAVEQELADAEAALEAADDAAREAAAGEAKKKAEAAAVARDHAVAAKARAAAAAARAVQARRAAQARGNSLNTPSDAPYDPPKNYFGNQVRTEQAVADAEIASIEHLIDALDQVTPTAEPHVPWRIYLTPALNRYVDFHLFSLLAWRQEPKTERKDTFTVWLRAFSTRGQPLPYRVIEETQVGPTFSTYLGGDLVDDFLGDSGTSGGAWGGGMYGGGRPGTGYRCGGRPGTGVKCGG
jgi:hypothetical protein